MERKQPLRHPKRGEVYLVSFDPTIGAEIKKTRPALVIQNDVGNRYSPVTIVAAISSKVGDTRYPTEVLIPSSEGGLREPSVVMLNQIRSVDKRRLIARLGRLSPDRMALVDQALLVSLGLVEL
jgi:mRNA interferase MazF